MKVCYFGTYERNYSRNRTIINGLKHNNVIVYECHEDIWRNNEHKTNFSLLGKVKFLAKSSLSYLKLLSKYLFVPEHDAIIVGYPGQIDMFVAKIAAAIRRKPLVFDAYLSLYDCMVNDRQVVKNKSLTAKGLYFVDKYSCKLADKILLDTNEHIKFFSKEFNVPIKKFCRVWIGANDRIFYPQKNEKFSKFTVVFHGKFIPLQGVDYIIEAAKELKKEDIDFIIIGAGQSFEKIKKKVSDYKLNNVKFKGFLPITEIAYHLSKCHAGLGIFGNTEKARRVIPNKAYEILAMKVPLITGETKAALEALEHEKDCLFCKMANPKSMAKAILKLKNDLCLRRELSSQGYNKFKKEFSIKPIGQEIKTVIENLILENH